MLKFATLSILIAMVGALVPAGAQEYVGPGKCKICHKKEKMGDQYGIWKEAKHSKAFEVLGTPEAKEAAAKLGVDDPQKSEACLICHTTAWEASADMKPGIELADGVSCEECHGPGSKFKPKDVHGESLEKAYAVGMTKLETDEQKLAVCQRCHVAERKVFKNPAFKEFNLQERLKEIAHPLKKED